MNRFQLLFCFFLLSTGIFAQVTEENKTHPTQIFPSLQLNAKEAPTASSVLQAVLPHLEHSHLTVENFELQSEVKSPYGTHYLFQLLLEGVKAENRYIKVFVDKAYRVRQVLALLDNSEQIPSGTFGDESVLRNQLTAMRSVGAIEKMWYYSDGWQALLKAGVIEDIGAYAEFRYYDASYRQVLSADNASRFHSHDSLVTAMVFWPDPLTSSQQPYGGSYRDFFDADSPAINNQRFARQVDLWFENDSFFLKDSSIYYSGIEAPASAIPVLADTLWDFNRSEQEFEYINSFYHMHTWIRRVHDLGFNLPGIKIQVDPHASNGADVSGFTPAYQPPALLFGEGGIDDAEDADVIIHELGHGLSYGASPGTSGGLERNSMEEGNCDYFAMSYSRQISNYGWEKTFNWDGNETWEGRMVINQRHYPDSLSVNKYYNAEMWVAAMTEIYDELGPDVTDRLVLCALYNQVSSMTFYQMVNNCLQCDSLQTGGANYGVIHGVMTGRGLAEPNAVRSPLAKNWALYNTAGFALGEGPMWLDFGGEAFSGSVGIYDIQGRLIQTYELQDAHSWTLEQGEIKKGLYVLRVQSHTNLSAGFLIEAY